MPQVVEEFVDEVEEPVSDLFKYVVVRPMRHILKITPFVVIGNPYY